MEPDGPSHLNLAVALGAGDHHGPADLMLNEDSCLTPHGAQSTPTRPCSAIDGRTVCHPGCGQSIKARRRIEQVFGLIKQAAGQSQLKPRAGPESVRCSVCMLRPNTCSAWPICS